jgi:putative membrane protein insertion efficiency factor
LTGPEIIGEVAPRQVAFEEVELAPSIHPLCSYSFPVRAALFALRFYKAYLSMLMAGSCRFQPTCSQFTYEAIARFGVLRGSWLGFLRLLRCQPFSRRFGIDPVPDEWPVRSADLSNHKEAHS